MRFKARIILGAFIVFIFYVSFKILEPELVKQNSSRGAGTRDDNPHKGLPPHLQTKPPHNDPGNAPNDPPEELPQGLGAGGEDVRKNNHTTVAIIEWLLSRYQLDWNKELLTSPWKVAAGWVKPREIHPDYTPEMGAILRRMSEATIESADVGHRGTQLKLSVRLEGGQRAAFKPQWYKRDYVVTGEPYAGGDRHNGEIAAFTLNRILGLRRSPLVVGRVIDLETEIKPVASPRLLKTFFTRDDNTCFYGKCLYCKSEADGVCAEGSRLEGALVLWLPAIWTFKMSKHPWSRTYRANKKAAWETYNDYCTAVKTIPQYADGPRLLDILDASVFDYLIGNADRHHYETFKDFNDSMLVMLDSAKSFGNPNWDERSILAPINQCCALRHKTWERLQLLRDGVLSTVMRELLSYDPLAPILLDAHYEAMDRRLVHILDVLEDCMQKAGADKVLVKDKFSAL